MQEIVAIHSFPSALRLVEERIEKIVDSGPVYIYWNYNAPPLDWKRGYYQFIIEGLDDLNPIEISTLTLRNIYDASEETIYYPILQNEYHYGYILIRDKRSLSKRMRRILSYFSNMLIYRVQQFLNLRSSEAQLRHDLQKEVAQDIHDGLAQKLFFLSAQLFSLKRALQPRFTEDEVNLFDKLSLSLDESLTEVRNYMCRLRDQTLEHDFLGQLKQMVESKTNSTGLSVNIHTNDLVMNERLEVLKAIYQVVEEATTNVIKHAKASILEISLEATPIQWCIRIKDNGIGLRNSKINNDRLGLVGMEEKIKRVNGFLSIYSELGKGTELVSIIPRLKNRERGNFIEAI